MLELTPPRKLASKMRNRSPIKAVPVKPAPKRDRKKLKRPATVRSPLKTKAKEQSIYTETESEEEDLHSRTYEARRRVAPSSSDDHSEEVYRGGLRDDFHTHPKHTPSQSSDNDSMYS